ncbi:MAG TPA: HAMP domain-containing sensor histidine kinase [Jatrophihabitans sp.]
MRLKEIASPVRVAGVAIPLAIGLAMAVGAVVGEHDRARADAIATVRANVASTVTKVRTEVRTELAAGGGGAAIEVVPAGRVAHARISPAVAVIARDSGAATLDDSARPPAIVVPVYRSGSTPPDTAARRSEIVGYRVVPLALQPTLAALQPISGGLVVRGPHRLVASAPQPPPPGSLGYGVDMDITGSPGWVVQAWLPDPGVPGVAWLWAAAILAVFAGLAGAIGFLQHRNAAHTARLRTLERDRALVTGLAPVMQASLDLGEVAPAVSAHLADGLALAGLSLSSPRERGETPLFSWGSPPDRSVRPSGAQPDRLARGETLALGLTRGGRTLGVLRIVAGSALSADDIVALNTASELLGSALANAEAFGRQQELVDRMRTVDELKTVFLATASHELRTPVTAIVGFSTLLLERWEAMPATQQRALLQRVQANGNRLAALIEQLLDFSQLESGLPRATDQVLDLGETVRRILAEQPELQTDHQLELDLAAGCHVRGSQAAVERVVTNLVSNAAKYSPADTTITVGVRLAGDVVTLLVDDQGSGVAVEDRDKVFSRFYRGRGDAVARTRGAGIGLAIVAEYAASMSGAARVSDAPGGGARFSITFPLVAAFAPSSSAGATDVAVS